MRISVLVLLAFTSPAIAGSAGPLPDSGWAINPNGINYLGLDVGGSENDYASAAATTSDGGLYLGGDVAVADGSGTGTGDYTRMGFAGILAAGSPDTAFGQALTTAFAQSNNGTIVNDIAVDSGNIVFIGQSYNNFTSSASIIGRYTTNGKLDTTFNSQGYRFIAGSALSGNLAATTSNGRLRVQPDGKILAIVNAGTDSPLSYCAGLVRLNADGSFDTNFGNGTGSVCYAPPATPPVAAAQDIALLQDGSILLAGVAAHVGGSGLDMAVVRLTATGALDTTFGNGGWAFVAFDQGGQLNDQARAIAVDSSGRIVIAGQYDDPTTDSIGVARLLANGAPDASFGTQGRVMLPFDIDANQSNDYVAATDVFIVGGDRILIGGNTTPGNVVGGYAVAAMLEADGALDGHFGNAGKYVQGNSSTAPGDVIKTTRMRLAGDYLYLIGNGVNTDNPGPGNAANHDFAAMRLIVPLFRSGFDPEAQP